MATGIVWTVMPRGLRAGSSTGRVRLEVSVAIGFIDHARPGAADGDHGDLPAQREWIMDWPGTLSRKLEGIQIDIGQFAEGKVARPRPVGLAQLDVTKGFRHGVLRPDAAAVGEAPIAGERVTACREMPLNSGLWEHLFRHTHAFRREPSKVDPPPLFVPPPVASWASAPVSRSIRLERARRGMLAVGAPPRPPDARNADRRRAEQAAYAQFGHDIREERALLAPEARPQSADDNKDRNRTVIGDAREIAEQRMDAHLYDESSASQRWLTSAKERGLGARVGEPNLMIERNRERIGVYDDGGPGTDLVRARVAETTAAPTGQESSRFEGVLAADHHDGVCQYGVDRKAFVDRLSQVSAAKGVERSAPPRPESTLAQAVAQVRDYVSLYRPLGLAIDVSIELDETALADVGAPTTRGGGRSRSQFVLRAVPRWCASVGSSDPAGTASESSSARFLLGRSPWSAVEFTTPLPASGAALWLASDQASESHAWIGSGHLKLGSSGVVTLAGDKTSKYPRFHVETLDVDSGATQLAIESLRANALPHFTANIDGDGFVVSSSLAFRELMRTLAKGATSSCTDSAKQAASATPNGAAAEDAPDPVQPGEFLPAYFSSWEVRIEARNLFGVSPDEPSAARDVAPGESPRSFAAVLRAFMIGNGRFRRVLRFECLAPLPTSPTSGAPAPSVMSMPRSVVVAVELKKLSAGAAAGSRLVRVRLACSIDSLPDDEPRSHGRDPLPAPTRTVGASLIWTGRAHDLAVLHEEAAALVKGVRGGFESVQASESQEVLLAQHAVLGFRPQLRESAALPARTVPPAAECGRQATGAPRPESSRWFSIVERYESWERKLWTPQEPSGSTYVTCRSFGLVQTALRSSTDAPTRNPIQELAIPPDSAKDVAVSESLFTYMGHSIGVPIPKEGASDRPSAIQGTASGQASTPDPVPLPMPPIDSDEHRFDEVEASLPRLEFVPVTKRSDGENTQPDESESANRYAFRVGIVDLAGNTPSLDNPSAEAAEFIREFDFQRHEPLLPPKVLFDGETYQNSPVPCEPTSMIVHAGHATDIRRLIPAQVQMQDVCWHGACNVEKLYDRHWRGASTFRLADDGSPWTVDCNRPRRAHCESATMIAASSDRTQEQLGLEQALVPVYEPAPDRKAADGWVYLPDPLAEYVRVAFIPDFGDARNDVTEVWVPTHAGGGTARPGDMNHAWPDAYPICVRLERSDRASAKATLRRVGPTGVAPTVRLRLPPGWSGRLELTSCTESGGLEPVEGLEPIHLDPESAGVRRARHLSDADPDAKSPDAELYRSFAGQLKRIRQIAAKRAEGKEPERGSVTALISDLHGTLERLKGDTSRPEAEVKPGALRLLRPEPLALRGLSETAAMRSRMQSSVEAALRALKEDIQTVNFFDRLLAYFSSGLRRDFEKIENAGRSALIGGRQVAPNANPGAGPGAKPVRVGVAPLGDDALVLQLLDTSRLYWMTTTPRTPVSRYLSSVAVGRNAVFSPPEVIEVKHAVRVPVGTPKLRGHVVGVRESDGRTKLHFDVEFDPRSTGAIEIRARSSVLKDAQGLLKSRVAESEEVVERFEIDALPYPEDGRASFDVLHALPDARYRHVAYTLVAISRYASLYPATKLDGLVARSEPLEIDVPSAVRPPPPTIDRVVPTFRWDVKQGALDVRVPDVVRVERRGAGLRVRLARPWGATGLGELLGVVVRAKEVTDRAVDQLAAHDDTVALFGLDHPPEPMRSFVSVWGMDPIGGEGSRSRTLHARDFEGPSAVQRVSLAAIRPSDSEAPPDGEDAVLVLGFPVHEDVQDGTWYADIQLSGSPSYAAFVRLAVVRFQPNGDSGALSGAQGPATGARDALFASTVVLAPPVQVWPNRRLEVRRLRDDDPDPLREGRDGLRVSLYGDWTVRREPLVPAGTLSPGYDKQMRDQSEKDWDKWLRAPSERTNGSGESEEIPESESRWVRPRNRYEILLLAATATAEGMDLGWSEIASSRDQPARDADGESKINSPTAPESSGGGAQPVCRSVHPGCNIEPRFADEPHELARWIVRIGPEVSLSLRLLVREFEEFAATLASLAPPPDGRDGEVDPLPVERVVYASVVGI